MTKKNNGIFVVWIKNEDTYLQKTKTKICNDIFVVFIKKKVNYFGKKCKNM